MGWPVRAPYREPVDWPVREPYLYRSETYYWLKCLARLGRLLLPMACCVSLPSSVSTQFDGVPPSVHTASRINYVAPKRHKADGNTILHDDVNLPDDVGTDEEFVSTSVGPESDSDTQNLFDDDESEDSEEQAQLLFSFLEESECDVGVVPSPAAAKHLVSRQNIAEFYSPPRVVPAGKDLGMRGVLSCDILTHWDFRVPDIQMLSLNLLTFLQITFLMLCPPCTIFSELMRLWNIKKMARDVFASKWAEGMVYLTHSMDAAWRQFAEGRFFAFEHPARASSWRQRCVMDVAALPGVHTVTFDQCMLGLTSKVSKKPMRKRTKIMTNSLHLVSMLQGKMCDKCHCHQMIHGTEGGMRRSTWAQIYPPPMVELLAKAAAMHSR